MSFDRLAKLSNATDAKTNLTDAPTSLQELQELAKLTGAPGVKYDFLLR